MDPAETQQSTSEADTPETATEETVSDEEPAPQDEQSSESPQNSQANFFIGNETDETLTLENNDIGTGNGGADTFVVTSDVSQNVSITDFVLAEDNLVIESLGTDPVTVTEQTVSDIGVVVTLSSGATITLQGLQSTLPEDAFAFVEPA